MYKFYFTLVIIFNSNLSIASIIDLDTITYDSKTNLEWLDVTETRGLTFVEVSAMMGIGQTLEGWRYAKVSEFDTLVANFGYVPVTTNVCNYGTIYCDIGMRTDSQIIEHMILTLGDTYDAYLDETNASLDANPLSAHSVVGLLNASDLTPNIPQVFSLIADQDTVYRSNGNVFSDGVDHVISYHRATALEGKFGSYLVRNATVVSEPAMLWFICIGLFSFLVQNRNKFTV